MQRFINLWVSVIFFCAWENVVEIGEELTEAKGANDDGLRFRSGMGGGL